METVNACFRPEHDIPDDSGKVLDAAEPDVPILLRYFVCRPKHVIRKIPVNGRIADLHSRRLPHSV
jgi:hypothetical protein